MESLYNNGKFKSWRRKHIKDIRNLFRLKQDIRKLTQENETKAIKDTKRYYEFFSAWKRRRLL